MPFPWEVQVNEDGSVSSAADNPLAQQAAQNQAELAAVGAIDAQIAQAAGVEVGAPSMFPPGLAPQSPGSGIDPAGLPDYLTNPSAYVTPPGAPQGLLPDGQVPEAGLRLDQQPQSPHLRAALGDQLNLSAVVADAGLELAEHTKLKCPKCDTVQSASNKKCTNCGHDLTKARGAKFAKLDASQETHQAVIYNTQGLNLAVAAADGLLWKVVCKTGTLALSPGPGQMDVEQPLVIDDDLFNEMVLSAEEKAFPYITIPETHANGALENTGYVRAWETLGRDELLADVRLPEKHHALVAQDPEDTRYLLAGMEFTEPDVKGKAERGTIPDTSIGVKFNFRNKRSGKTYKVAWEHVALTPMPWIDGLPAFGLSADGPVDADDATVPFDGVYLGIQARVTADGNRYDWELENINPAQVRADVEQALSVIDSDSKLELPMGVCITRFGEYWVVNSDYDKIAGIAQQQNEALDLAMATLKTKYNEERARRERGSGMAEVGSQTKLAPWPDADANYSVDGKGGLNLAIYFDPKAHPRDWKGRFRSIVGKLKAGEAVDLPDGTRVTKTDDHGFYLSKLDQGKNFVGWVDTGHANNVEDAVKKLDQAPDVATPAELPPEPSALDEYNRTHAPVMDTSIDQQLTDTFGRIQIDDSNPDHVGFSLPGGDDEEYEYGIERGGGDNIITSVKPDEFVLTEYPFDAWDDNLDAYEAELLTHHALGTTDMGEAIKKAHAILKDRIGAGGNHGDKGLTEAGAATPESRAAQGYTKTGDTSSSVPHITQLDQWLKNHGEPIDVYGNDESFLEEVHKLAGGDDDKADALMTAWEQSWDTGQTADVGTGVFKKGAKVHHQDDASEASGTVIGVKGDQMLVDFPGSLYYPAGYMLVPVTRDIQVEGFEQKTPKPVSAKDFKKQAAGFYATPDGHYAVISDGYEHVSQTDREGSGVTAGITGGEWAAIYDPKGQLNADHNSGDNLDWFSTKAEALAHAVQHSQRHPTPSPAPHYETLANAGIFDKRPAGFKLKKPSSLPDAYDIKKATSVAAVHAPDGTHLGYVGKVDYGGERVMSGNVQVGTSGAGKRWAAFTVDGQKVGSTVYHIRTRDDALRELGRYHPQHGRDAPKKKTNLSQDATAPERRDLSRRGDPASLPADREQQTSQTGDTEDMPRVPRQRPQRTVEELLASQQAELEAAQQRIAELEGSNLQLSGQLSATSGQLNQDAISKRVRKLQEAGYPPVLCLAVKRVMSADKSRLELAGRQPDEDGHLEGGLNLSISHEVPAASGEGTTLETKTLQTPTDVAEYLLSAMVPDTENAAALLASVSDDIADLHLSQRDEANDDDAKKAAVDAMERERHPERFKDDGKGERI